MGPKHSKGSISEFNTIKKKDCKLYLQVIQAMQDPACIIGPNFKIKTINRSFLNLLGFLDVSSFKNKAIKSILKKFSPILPEFQSYFGLSSLVSAMQILVELGNAGSKEFCWELNTLYQKKVYLKVRMNVIFFGGKSSLQLIAHEISLDCFKQAISEETESNSFEMEGANEMSSVCDSECENDINKNQNEKVQLKLKTKKTKKSKKTKKTKNTKKPKSTKKSKAQDLKIEKNQSSKLNTPFTQETNKTKNSNTPFNHCKGASLSEEKNSSIFGKESRTSTDKKIASQQSKIFEDQSENTKEQQTNITFNSSSITTSDSAFLKIVDKEFETVDVY
ncbi:histone deacetylase 4 [Anaeramoeba flamelloides]|uniref:Histone deacetylase 4 n=1 Tax=Anaeramoeba flamelloides TaxID=1746091 RepID=A0ABQ8X549_9EUKA|nr:histone deacetylase 4 [Anaeramoeba flamelloides]